MNSNCPWQQYERAHIPDESARIQAALADDVDKIVVLDDDPTGCQTVHDIRVLFQWDEASLRGALTSSDKLFYVLTNIRSVSAAEAEARHWQVATRLSALASELGVRLHIISRSDSTLRGHFPADLRPFWSVGGKRGFDAILLIPAFFEGGRYTFHGTHYVRQGENCVPADETEFARDKAFGFQSSYLPAWVAEKWPEQAGKVEVLGLETIRRGEEAVATFLAQATHLLVISVDAVDYHDLEIVALACLAQQRRGQEFLIRSAASFVRVYGGISAQALLRAEELVPPGRIGGLVMVGSYVSKTTSQLAQLLELEDLVPVELDVEKIVHGELAAEVSRAIDKISAELAMGNDVVCYTSRKLFEAATATESLQVGRVVADAVNGVVKFLDTRPSFLIAKGGITSHEVAELGLGVQSALVTGQISAGVPVWELGPESKWPGLPYVVFPGNVGNEDSLRHVVEGFRAARRRESIKSFK